MLKSLCFSTVILFAVTLAVAQQKPAKTLKKTTSVITKDAKSDPPKPAPEVIRKDSVKEVKVKGFQAPEFPGGKAKLNDYLTQNLKYPESARKDKVEGDVFVRFMVKKDGTIVTPKVISGLGSGCDQEAIRLLTTMPKWTPGKKDDEPVDMPYTMYIHFVLDTEK